MGTALRSYEPEFISHVIHQMKGEGCVSVYLNTVFLCVFGIFLS